MKVGLVDVDGHNFPNLALMKLSAWHKRNGDAVEMAWPLRRYDRVYMSKVFSLSPDDFTAWMSADVRKGGTGYDLTSRRRTSRRRTSRRKKWQLSERERELQRLIARNAEISNTRKD